MMINSKDMRFWLGVLFVFATIFAAMPVLNQGFRLLLIVLAPMAYIIGYFLFKK